MTTTTLRTYWICTAHLTDPSITCTERGEGDTGAARHTERAPKHSTLTTTRRDLADKLAYHPHDATADLCTWCAAGKCEKCSGPDHCAHHADREEP